MITWRVPIDAVHSSDQHGIHDAVVRYSAWSSGCIDALITFNWPIDPTAVVLVILCNGGFLLHTENGADEDRHM